MHTLVCGVQSDHRLSAAAHMHSALSLSPRLQHRPALHHLRPGQARCLRDLRHVQPNQRQAAVGRGQGHRQVCGLQD